MTRLCAFLLAITTAGVNQTKVKKLQLPIINLLDQLPDAAILEIDVARNKN